MTKLNLKLADLHLRGQDQSMRSVENKASSLMTISAMLFSFSLAVLPKAINVFNEYIKDADLLKNVEAIIIGILFFAYTILIILGINKLLHVIAPTIISKLKSDKKSLIFFEDIKREDPISYRQKWHKIDDDEVINELADRIYNTAHVISGKYKDITNAVMLLKWGALLAMIFILIVNIL